jgi:hypothetical protein
LLPKKLLAPVVLHRFLDRQHKAVPQLLLQRLLVQWLVPKVLASLDDIPLPPLAQVWCAPLVSPPAFLDWVEPLPRSETLRVSPPLLSHRHPFDQNDPVPGLRLVLGLHDPSAPP